jgi:hypothetical protein
MRNRWNDRTDDKARTTEVALYLVPSWWVDDDSRAMNPATAASSTTRGSRTPRDARYDA